MCTLLTPLHNYTYLTQVKFPEGESFDDLYQRALRFIFEELLPAIRLWQSTHSDPTQVCRVLIVSHFYFLTELLAAFTDTLPYLPLEDLQKAITSKQSPSTPLTLGLHKLSPFERTNLTPSSSSSSSSSSSAHLDSSPTSPNTLEDLTLPSTSLPHDPLSLISKRRLRSLNCTLSILALFTQHDSNTIVPSSTTTTITPSCCVSPLSSLSLLLTNIAIWRFFYTRIHTSDPEMQKCIDETQQKERRNTDWNGSC